MQQGYTGLGRDGWGVPPTPPLRPTRDTMPRKTSSRPRRNYGRRIRRRLGNRKPSILDLVSVAPGAAQAVGELGGLEKAMGRPKELGQLLMLNYLGRNPNGVGWNFKRALDTQWKPFAIIQIAKRVMGKVMPKAKRFKIFGWKVL